MCPADLPKKKEWPGKPELQRCVCVCVCMRVCVHVCVREREHISTMIKVIHSYLDVTSLHQIITTTHLYCRWMLTVLKAG